MGKFKIDGNQTTNQYRYGSFCWVNVGTYSMEHLGNQTTNQIKTSNVYQTRIQPVQPKLFEAQACEPLGDLPHHGCGHVGQRRARSAALLAGDGRVSMDVDGL